MEGAIARLLHAVRGVRLFREGETESASFTRDRLQPDSSAVVLHDKLAERQTDSVAGDFLRTMQPHEHFKDPLLLFGRHAKAVVQYSEGPVAFISFGSHVDMQRGWPRYLIALPIRF